MRVTIKLVDPMIGGSDVVVMMANRIDIVDGLIIVKKLALDTDDFLTAEEEIMGIFRCEDVRAIYRTERTK